jgi:hypothetical protein
VRDLARGDVHRVRHLGKNDLLMAVTFRRGLRQTIEGAKKLPKTALTA